MPSSAFLAISGRQEGDLPLHEAARNGHVAVAQELLRRGRGISRKRRDVESDRGLQQKTVNRQPD